MSKSTFDTVLEKTWTSNGSVTFPDIALTHDIPEDEIKLGYYPCYGATFAPKDLETDPFEERDVHAWDPRENGNSRVKVYKRAPKAIRQLKLTVKNPVAADEAELKNHIRPLINDRNAPYGAFAPQALMQQQFIDCFNSLVFDERADNLLVSNAVEIATPEYLDRKGNHFKKDPATYSVVFFITHIMFKGVPTMITEARWTVQGRVKVGYISLYGCC
jgi:hypothetical protein